MNPVSRISANLWGSASDLLQKSTWRAADAVGELTSHPIRHTMDGLLEVQRATTELRLGGVLIRVAQENDDTTLNLLA